MTGRTTPGADGLPDLAGTLYLRPGAPVGHNLRSTRRALVGRLSAGQPASVLPGLLGSLFSLCGQSHRLCSLLALQAAAPGLLPPAPPPGRALQRETAAEHVRRIGLDWPRLLLPDESAAAALADLRNCPWLATRADAPTPWAEALDWLQARWLHMAPDTWLRLWRSDGADWLRAWSERHDGWLARLLHAARPADVALDLNAVPALRPHGPQGDPYALGRELAGHDTEPATLEWQGQPAHTGSWTRLRDAATSMPASAWALLGGRIAELVRLSLPDDPAQAGAGWLHWGARPLGPGQALAWVEMARGLLIHYVRLDGVADGEPRVAACQVLAPTDWNFHPRGVAARALAHLPADHAHEPGPPVRLLMAALDPCVPFHLDDDAAAPTRAPAAMETDHA